MLTENRLGNITSPQVKVKYRSIVPTVFSLLADDPVTMISENGKAEIHTMEVKCQGSKEVTQMNESSPISNPRSYRFSKGPYSYENPIRFTEDIYMREDEDGVLSHFCPLNKNRDGIRDEAEQLPDTPPTKVDYANWIKNGCNLDSEEIPYLMAEPPVKSEDSSTDNTEVSNIDSSTSMIYSHVQNQQFIQKEDKELQSLLQGRTQSPSFQTLDKKILKAWSEVSSDEEFYVPREDDEELLKKYGFGNESDMEEFETNDAGNNEVSKFVGNEIHQKTVLLEEESLKNDPEEESEKNTASEPSNENSGGVNVENNEEKNSNTEEVDGEKDAEDGEKDATERKKDAHGKSDGCNKQNDSFQSDDDQVPIELLKSEVRNAMIEAAVSLNLSAFEFQETVPKDSTIATDEKDDVGINKVEAPLEDPNVRENCKNLGHHEETLSPEKDQEKREGNKPSEDSVADGKVEMESFACRMETKTNVLPNSKEVKQQKFSMEPVAMNLSKTEEEQPDLKTALRFMTEVYHSKEDDYLCLDSLSDMDVPLNNPKAVVKKLDEKPIGILTSPKKSSNFESDLAAETKTVIRPRNKLTKLFSSFKKKLGKKA